MPDIRQWALTLALLLGTTFGYSQHGPGLSIKTWPARFIYGANAEISLIRENMHMVSFMYQDHQRDYFTVPGSEDFSSLPHLAQASGYTAQFMYLFPIRHDGQTQFWWGPKVGYKEITGFTEDYNFQGQRSDVVINQSNMYYLAQFSFRVNLNQFFFETYLHAGLVNIRWEGRYFDPVNTLSYIDDSWSNYWLPHGLLGIAVGYHFER